MPALVKRGVSFVQSSISELKNHVTWPTRKDTIRWAGVVLCALVFFGVTVFLLDNFVITPSLICVSGLG